MTRKAGGAHRSAIRGHFLRLGLFRLDVQLADQSPVEIGLPGNMGLEFGAAFGVGVERLRGELRLDLRSKEPRAEPLDELRERFSRLLCGSAWADPHVGFAIGEA